MLNEPPEKFDPFWFIVLGVLVLWGIAILVFGASASASTEWTLLDSVNITDNSTLATISFQNIPYRDNYEIKGKFRPDLSTMPLGSRIRPFFNKKMSSSYYKFQKEIITTTTPADTSGNGLCEFIAPNAYPFFAFLDMEIYNSDWSTPTETYGMGYHGMYFYDYFSTGITHTLVDISCSFKESTANTPISRIDFIYYDTGSTYYFANFASGTSVELWGSQEVNQPATSSSTTINLNTDVQNADSILFHAFILFILGFIFPIWYFRKQHKWLKLS